MMCVDTAKADYVAMTASREHEKFLQELVNKPYNCPVDGYICKLLLTFLSCLSLFIFQVATQLVLLECEEAM